MDSAWLSCCPRPALDNTPPVPRPTLPNIDLSTSPPSGNTIESGVKKNRAYECCGEADLALEVKLCHGFN